jgi:hypothetical protein
MKARTLRILVLIFGTALFSGIFFQNCAPVAFKAEEPSTALAAKENTDPVLCEDGQVSGSVRWDLVSGQNIEEPGQCDNGGNLTFNYEKLQKLICENGKYTSSSDIKKGNLVGQKGGCNCAGGVTNGMSTWKNLVDQNITESQACPANGTLSLIYEKQQKYTCDNGKLVSSEVFQKGKLIKQEGVCNCADGSAEGSSTYKLVPNATITEPGLCVNGGNLQYIYEKKQKFICQSSQSVAYNEFIKGNLLNTTGACGCVGGIASGGFKFDVLAGQNISEPATCKYGGNLANIYEKLEKNLCTNGTFSATGVYQKGAFLRQDGACNPPPVLTETFSISAVKTAKPLDMIWVVDNSGSMSEEAANVRNNLTNFISALDKSVDMKFLLISQKSTGGFFDYGVTLPTGLDATRFMQKDIFIDSYHGPDVLLSELKAEISAGKPFFRSDSKKIIVFVTDDNATMTAASFTSGLNNVGVGAGQAAVFGFVGLGGPLSPCQWATGLVYQSLATQSGGKTYNICAVDWTQNFSALHTDVLTKLGRSYTLLDPMVTKITKVEVDGVAIDASMYSYANGVLTVSDQVNLTELSSIKIYYNQ